MVREPPAISWRAVLKSASHSCVSSWETSAAPRRKYPGFPWPSRYWKAANISNYMSSDLAILTIPQKQTRFGWFPPTIIYVVRLKGPHGQNATNWQRSVVQMLDPNCHRTDSSIIYEVFLNQMLKIIHRPTKLSFVARLTNYQCVQHIIICIYIYISHTLT